jgi:acetamidase/formamidase
LISHCSIPVNPKTVHWGYFSKAVPPVVHVASGDFAAIETSTHHAGDDHERMIRGDAAGESVYAWTPDVKNVHRRGAGRVVGGERGAAERLGVHVLTGPVYVHEAGDVLEVRILVVRPRPSMNPAYKGRAFGVNLAASWGLRYRDLIEAPTGAARDDRKHAALALSYHELL